MSTENQKETEGRLWWVIPILEFLVFIAYFTIGFGGIAYSASQGDLGGIVGSTIVAIIFLEVAILVIAILCFVPIFKSKGNVRWAIWNIIWFVINIYIYFIK